MKMKPLIFLLYVQALKKVPVCSNTISR